MADKKVIEKKVKVVEYYSKDTKEKILKDLWEKQINVWYKRFTKRTRNFFFQKERLAIHTRKDRQSYHELGDFISRISDCFTLPRFIFLFADSKENVLFIVEPHTNYRNRKTKLNSCENIHVDRVLVSVKHHKSMKHARILAKWLQEHPEWCDKVVIVKDYV